jgi:hypothetical protein
MEHGALDLAGIAAQAVDRARVINVVYLAIANFDCGTSISTGNGQVRFRTGRVLDYVGV